MKAQYSFTHFGTNVGLVSTQINSVVQDEKGFIWIATTDGIQRFDGVRYKTFRHRQNDSTSIPSNPVVQLMLDKGNNLWLLFATGQVGIFNTKTFRFSDVPLDTRDKMLLAYAFKRLKQDDEGNIFYSALGVKVLTYNRKANVFSDRYNFFKTLPTWRIGDIYPQPGTKKYWISIQDSGIAIYNHATGLLSYAHDNAEHEPAIDDFEGRVNPSNMMFDSKGRIWFDTWGPGFPYVYCYDIHNRKMILEKYHFLDLLGGYYETHGFMEQKDGSIWIKGAALFAKFNEATHTFELVHNGYENEHSIVFESVKCLFEDRENNIWVGTSDNGLFRFNPAEQYFFNISHINRLNGKPGQGSPMSFMYTSWGTILAGVWGDGLYHYDINLNQIPVNIKGFKENESLSIWSMIASKDSNTIWMGAQPGIIRVDQGKRAATYYNPAIIKGRTVRQVAEDRYGNLWLGMQSIGVFKWDAKKGKSHFDDGIKKLNSFPDIQVNKITVDSKGYIWVGTTVSGCYVIDPATDSIIMHFSKSATSRGYKLPEDGVSSVMEYNDSLMVITTATRIVLYNRLSNSSSLIGTTETMSGYISSVEKDKNGYLWVANTNGLYRVNLHNRIFVQFNREDGMNNDNFTTAASYVLPDGRILLGNSTMFIAFNPAKIRVSSSYPDVTITDFRVMNKSLLVDSLLQLEKTVLKADANSIVIEFSTLSQGGAFLIKYKMDGLDKDWQVADKNFHAVYSYLPPGDYTFLVKSEDAEGVSSTNITTMRIEVEPPFWKAWWFYSILALAGAALLYWIDRERMKRKESIHNMRSDIAGNLHQDINTALNNINILSEIARIKAIKDPDKSIEYLEQIHTKSENMIIAMDDMLWSIDPANDSMQKTIDRMRENLDAVNNREGIHITMEVDQPVIALELNMRARYDIFLLFREALKSLVKACAVNCQIQVSFNRPNLIFTFDIKNEGCLIRELSSLAQNPDFANRLDQINADLDVQVHKTDTVILLRVPVIHSNLL